MSVLFHTTNKADRKTWKMSQPTSITSNFSVLWASKEISEKRGALSSTHLIIENYSKSSCIIDRPVNQGIRLATLGRVSLVLHPSKSLRSPYTQEKFPRGWRMTAAAAEHFARKHLHLIKRPSVIFPTWKYALVPAINMRALETNFARTTSTASNWANS